jgi:hypothetical protein
MNDLDRRRGNLRFQVVTPTNNFENYDGPTLKDGFMAPPPGPILTNENDPDVLGRWHYDYKHNYEMGILFTLIAGILNFLAIYDAFVGPAIVTPRQQEKLESKKK